MGLAEEIIDDSCLNCFSFFPIVLIINFFCAEHLMIVFKGGLISAQYFHKAMDEYRNQFVKSSKDVLMFVVASDDLQWCKDNFKNLTDVFYVDDGNSPLLDLAIMSKCNHSIVDVGTFGQWGAFLAGGKY